MDYGHVSSRTRSKTTCEKAGLDHDWEMNYNIWVSPASRRKQVRRSNQASVFRVGESSSGKQSIEWVVGHVESLENKENDDVLEGFDYQESVMRKSGEKGKGKGAVVGQKRKRSLGVDALANSNNNGCSGRHVSDNGVKVFDIVDSDVDDEVVVSKGKEGGGGGGVDFDDVSDGGGDNDIDNESSSEGDGSSDECVELYVLSSDEECVPTEEDSTEEECVSSSEESTEEESDDEYVLSSDEDSSEEEKEEEAELIEKNVEEYKGESVEVGLKDLHSSSGQDINDRSERLVEAETGLVDTRTGCDDYKVWRVSKKEQNIVVGSKEDRNGYVLCQCKQSEGDRSITKKKSTRAPKQNRVPTVVFQPPKVEYLPLRFSFAKQPTIPEKSDYVREVDNLFDELESAIAFNDASIDSKANRNDLNDETYGAYGGSPETRFHNGRKIDLQTAFNENKAAKGNNSEMHCDTSASGVDVLSASKNGVEAKKNLSRSINTRNNGNGKTYGDDGSYPEPYKNKGVKKLTGKKGIASPKYCNAFSILLDSVYDKGELPGEKLPPFGDESLKDEATRDETPRDRPLPLFFTLGRPPSPPPEKSAFEIEVDQLFDDYNFVLMSGEIGSTDFHVVETKDTAPLGKEVTQHVLCSQGKHVLELDEEIGLICRYCSHVHLEIKYVIPDFAPNPYGKSGMRYYEEDNRSKLDDLQCNDNNDFGYNAHAHTKGTVWDLIPGVENDMYPHQREGFEFIWRHLAGGIQLAKLAQPSDYDGDGCIISHAPGTGKTRLTIIFIQSYMNFNPSSRPLIVAPRTMLLTWEDEFKKWGFDIPFHNLNNPDFTGKEDEAARNLVKDGNRKEMTNLTRLVKLKSWAKTRSILGISYTLFEKICGATTKNRRRVEVEHMSKILLEFPGLVVFDEGHNPRNNQSYSWNALLKLKTRRRILLSGTPFQNNFEELYNTVRLVRPDWTTNLTCLGGFDKRQWASYQIRGRKGNVRKCQFADDNKKLAREVRDIISPFVHVYKGTILQDKLPGLRNSVVVLHPTALQQRYLDISQRTVKGFKYEQIETKVSVHPSLLLKEERSITSMFQKEEENSGDWKSLTDIKLNPEGGVKARFVVDLIRLSQAMNERVLVFCQFVDPLNFIMKLLECQFHWKEGEQVIYMDGKCDNKARQSSMSDFNNATTKAKVLLATIKSCNEGISLVGASRVVLLDVAWNPSVVRQAISRAYRVGQKKVVYIYHLLMAGAKEEDKYSCQVEKHRLSELVFSCSDREAAKKISAAVVTDKILEEMVQHEKLKHIFQKITLLDEAS